MAENRYIVVEGVIGVGKTSLARLLCERLQGRLVLEEVEENPFLKDFYQDRARFAFWRINDREVREAALDLSAAEDLTIVPVWKTTTQPPVTSFPAAPPPTR